MADRGEKLDASAEEASVAALMWVAALCSRLVQKRVLDPDEANEIAATAASMAKAQGTPGAARVIEAIVPTSVGVDPVAAALDRGVTVRRQSK